MLQLLNNEVQPSHGKTKHCPNKLFELCTDSCNALILTFCVLPPCAYFEMSQVCAARLFRMLNWIYSWAEEEAYQSFTWIEILYKAAPAKTSRCYCQQFCHEVIQYELRLYQFWSLPEDIILERNKSAFTNSVHEQQVCWSMRLQDVILEETNQLLLTVSMSNKCVDPCGCKKIHFTPEHQQNK